MKVKNEKQTDLRAGGAGEAAVQLGTYLYQLQVVRAQGGQWNLPEMQVNPRSLPQAALDRICIAGSTQTTSSEVSSCAAAWAPATWA